MGRIKGSPKTGGRQAGTPNRVTVELRDFVSNLIDDNRGQILDDLKKLKPTERLSFLERLMQYVIPKQQTVKANVNTDFNGTFCIKARHMLDGKEITDEEYKKLDIPKPASSEDEVDMERDWRDYPKVISEVYLERLE